MKKITILLVDDQTIIREGLWSLLETHPDIQVIGEAKNGKEAYEQTAKLRPQVVLMDIRMPVMGGVEATKLIKRDYPETAVLVLSTFDDDESIIGAIINGASGYFLKDISGTELAETIKETVQGKVVLPRDIATKITKHISWQGKSDVSLDDFTEREKDIIRLMMLGKTNQEIAQMLFLTVGTVKNYISQIYSKTGITDRANAILYFKKLGF